MNRIQLSYFTSMVGVGVMHIRRTQEKSVNDELLKNVIGGFHK
jgi:hypothetical protein